MSKKNKPNILFIICHDLGQHLGCYGVKISTPNIDKLAYDGVRFNNSFCAAAQCSPSRGSIMTGKYPHLNGLMGLAHIGWELKENEKKLPTYLKEAGYETHLFGVQHESANPESLDYNIVHKCSGRAEEATDETIKWLKQRIVQKTQTPFYISLGFIEPHRGYPHDNFEYDIDNPDTVELLPYLPDKPGIRKDIAGLNGLIHRVDDSIGRLIHTLDETGLKENTLIIFTTDHGIAMPRAKGTCYDPGIKVAFIMHLLGRFEGGKFYSELITNIDYLPTLIEFVGGSPPENVNGKSFLPLLDGKKYDPRDHIFCEMTWHDRYNPMRAVRTNRFKYIKNFGDRPLVYIPSDIFKGSAGQEMCDQFYGKRRPSEELYDFTKDSLEIKNLVEFVEYQDILVKLRNMVESWMKSTNDPLLNGDVPPTEKQRIRETTDLLPNR